MRSKNLTPEAGTRRNPVLQRLRLRLVLLFVAVFGAVLLVYSGFLFNQFRVNHQSEFDTSLFNYTVDIARSMEVNILGGVTLTPNLLAEGEKVFPFALGESFIQVRTTNGRTLARSRSLGKRSLPLHKEDSVLFPSKRAVFRTLSEREIRDAGIRRGSYRLVTYFIDRPTNFDLILQVAVPMQLFEREESGLLTFFAFSIPLVLLAAGLGGLLLSRKALEPLQEAIRSQEAFIADASHQLKTPLAILRGEVDLMRSKPRSAEEIRDFLRSVSQEVTHLSRMIEDLLLLARTDAPAASRMIEAVRLDEVLLELIPKFQKLAEARQVRLALNFADQATFEIRGEPMLVRAAIGNVLDNAVKYATPGSQVSVELSGDKDAVVVQVWNAGEAIPPEAMARIFERFFRAESDEHGSGLGLSIVKRILDIHQGEVALENREGGILCRLRFRRGLKNF